MTRDAREYSDDEIVRIIDGCVAVAALMAKADGRVSKGEVEAFLRDHMGELRGAAILDRPYEEAIMRSLADLEHSPAHFRETAALSNVELQQRVADAYATVCHNEREPEIRGYRDAMNDLALDIAKSAKGPLRLGRAISKSESQMLARIRHILTSEPNAAGVSAGASRSSEWR